MIRHLLISYLDAAADPPFCNPALESLNELHVPVSDEQHPTPTHITLLSADTDHSFWVPKLSGKTDLIPNRTNSMLIAPHETGVYLGQCAQYCGTQHAKMLLRVISDETLLDSTIGLKAHLVGDPHQPFSSALATHEESENKLLQAAELSQPTDGEWMLNIAVRHNLEGANFLLPIKVVKREAGAGYPWPYFVITVLAAILLSVYVRRHRKTATSQTQR